jgi:hypothetical protein
MARLGLVRPKAVNEMAAVEKPRHPCRPVDAVQNLQIETFVFEMYKINASCKLGNVLSSANGRNESEMVDFEGGETASIYATGS